MDSPARMIVKALLWQAMGLLVMVAISVLITGSLRVGGTVALANMLVGLVSYVIYEWVWNRIDWGRSPGRPRRGRQRRGLFSPNPKVRDFSNVP